MSLENVGERHLAVYAIDVGSVPRTHGVSRRLESERWTYALTSEMGAGE